MIIGNQDIALDSKKVFFQNIKGYYSEKNKNVYSEELIDELSDVLAYYFFKQYNDFRIEYPKSIKRYSKLKLNDLENPFTHDKIITFAKEKYFKNYIGFCSQMFGMTKEEFLKYEKNREKFNNW